MTVSFLLGRPGAGKSYSALKMYILPALKKGRRVLHNVGGLDLPNCHNYGAKPFFPKVHMNTTSDLIFSNPYAVDEEGNIKKKWVDGEQVPEVMEDNPSICRAGDLLVIDEFFLVAQAAGVVLGSRITPYWIKNLEAFMRAHRHMVDDVKGFPTDIVIMAQTNRDIPTTISDNAERTHICKTAILRSGFSKLIHKLLTGKAVGNKLRRLDYDGFRVMKGASAANAVMVSEYFPTDDIFKHYRSYTGNAVQESARGFSMALIVRTPLILFVISITACIYFLPDLLDTFGLSDDDDEVVAEQQHEPPPAAVVVLRDICHLRIDGICKNKGSFVVK